MTAESKIQPILCCAGEAVAGRPTQFLMERALAARHCDWRVVTVEIQREDFQRALDGMRAMRFKALRFFPEFQDLAASCLAPPTDAPFNAVTSAIWKGDGWNCWDNQGLGLLDLIANGGAPENLVIWLHGHSRLTHSLSKAMQASEFAPGCLLWSTSKEELSVAGDAATRSEVRQLSLTEVEQALQESLSDEKRFSRLVVVGESLVGQLDLISRLEAQSETALSLATNQLLTRQQVNDVWRFGKIEILSEDDQLIAAEAYDFRRWTGQPVDIDMLRDAYDEYSDF